MKHVNKASFSRRDLLKSYLAMLTASMASVTVPIAFSEELSDLEESALEDMQVVRTIENLWIPLPDGKKLAARVWLPVGAEANPVPAVLEYLPYRKRDLNRGRDDYVNSILARHGYACIRVDIRGTGESTGLLDDEYLKQEQDDGLVILSWLAEQSWCTGSVGMRGISWGGFNSLQIAARRPPQLKAIVTHGSTDDRYTDDAHYIGGSLGHVQFEWGQLFMNVLSLPPDPEIFGPTWRDEWLKRLENVKPVAHEWTKHQSRDSFWQHGSVNENYSDIQIPVYAVGGFVDGYTNAVPRMLSHLDSPRKGFIGPQGHQFPDLSNPGPGVDFLAEEVRWWDKWLKGIETGIMDEPMIQAYMQEKTPGSVYPKHVPGRWVAEHEWPSSRIVGEKYFMNTGGLSDKPEDAKAASIKPDLTVGLKNTQWLPFMLASELPKDQTEDDLKSIIFDSQVIKESFEIFGQPVARLNISADKPVARVAVRLNEIDEDGIAWNVTSGYLNLTHRSGHELPEPLVPGKFYDIEFDLNMIAYRFKKGCRIRIAISESYWPMLWPSPEPVKLTMRTGRSSIELPVRPPGEKDLENLEFAHPAPRDISGMEEIEKGAYETENFGPDEEGNFVVRSYVDTGLYKLTSTGTATRMVNHFVSKINPSNPNSSTWEGYISVRLARGAWDVETRSDFKMTSNTTTFFLETNLVASEKGKVVFGNKWTDAIPRNLT